MKAAVWPGVQGMTLEERPESVGGAGDFVVEISPDSRHKLRFIDQVKTFRGSFTH